MNSDTVEIHTARHVISEVAFDTVAALLKLISDPKSHAARFKELKELVAAVATAEQKLADARAGFAEYERKTRAELEAEQASITKRRLAVGRAEGELDARAAYVSRLEKAWAGLGEPDEVLRGFKDPEMSALAKAKRAHADAGLDSLDPAFAASLPVGSTLARDAGA